MAGKKQPYRKYPFDRQDNVFLKINNIIGKASKGNDVAKDYLAAFPLYDHGGKPMPFNAPVKNQCKRCGKITIDKSNGPAGGTWKIFESVQDEPYCQRCNRVMATNIRADFARHKLGIKRVDFFGIVSETEPHIDESSRKTRRKRKSTGYLKAKFRAYSKTKSGKEPHSHNGEDVHAADYSLKDKKKPKSKSKSKSKSYETTDMAKKYTKSKMEEDKKIQEYADEHGIKFMKAKFRMMKQGLI